MRFTVAFGSLKVIHRRDSRLTDAVGRDPAGSQFLLLCESLPVQE